MENVNDKIIIYQTADGVTYLEVKMDYDTVWLTQAQMVELFQTTKQNVSLHVNNVYKECELEEKSTVKEYLTVQNEGKRSVRRMVKYYNLDVIISVGYRVKSQRGTQFRIWANRVLKDYLVKGYAVNERIHKEQIGELRQLVGMLGRTIQNQPLLCGDRLHLRTRHSRQLRLPTAHRKRHHQRGRFPCYLRQRHPGYPLTVLT